MFDGLSDREKSFISNRAQAAERNKDDIIYNEGQKKSSLYIVISGRILLFHPSSKSPAKEEAAVEILRKGDYFGIISLLTGRPHSLSAKALNDARLLEIDEKSFKQILNKIPQLAIRISGALSRRLKEEYAGVKEIFQSTIISVYSDKGEEYSSDYALKLAKNIKKESGKKVVLLNINKKHLKAKSGSSIKEKTIHTDNPKDASSILNEFTNNFHYIIVDLPSDFNDAALNFAKQADLCHMIIDDSPESIKKIESVIKKLKDDTRRPEKDFIKIILKEGIEKFPKKVEKKEEKIIKLPVYATLPHDKDGFNNAVRRISRDASGILVGLALGSGGAIGLAQIGALKVFEENNIPIDVIAGTSIGALISALWVSGYNTKEISKICAALNTRLKTLTLVDITFPKMGFIAGRNVRNFIHKYLKNRTFRDVKMPFKIVACDIRTREEVVITEGKLIDAVMASIAIPGVFNPYVTEDGRLLVDGGIVNPVPISVLSKSGVKRIIAVNTMPSPEDIVNVAAKKQTILDILVNSLYSMEYRIAKYACQEADVYLHPILKNAAWYEFYRAKEFIKVGVEEAKKALPKIRALVK